jgi:biotin carboxyl carrier protein
MGVVVQVTVPDVWGDDSRRRESSSTASTPRAPRSRRETCSQRGGREGNFEIEAPASGLLARVLAPVNTPVRPGTAVAEIEMG